MVKKYLCKDCGKRRGKENYDFKCYFCWRKTKTSINLPFPLNGRNKISIEEAQNKTRKVNTSINKKDGSLHNLISVPSCYIGKKVRVIVVEGKWKT